MKRILLGAVLIFGSASAKNCDIDVGYHQNGDGTITIHIKHSSNCKMSVSLTEDGSDIKFTPQRSSCRVSTSSSSKRIKVKVPQSDKSNSEIIDRLISIAKSKVGSRYKSGATGPNSFDCSGFVYYAYKNVGIKIPRVSTNQAKIGKKLSRSELKKGDIVCFDTAKRGHVNHTGIYLGDGRFIHASSGRAYSVTVSNLDKGFYKEKFRWGTRVLK